jgi:hypothetical protein
MIRLATTSAGALRNLLADGRDAAAWHAALTAEIAAHLSPAHAAVLATPVKEADVTHWDAAAARAVRYPDLPPADRPALMRAVTVILSDIRRLAESGAAPTVTRCWPMLREIPELNWLFAADGAPVLAGWGAVSHSAGGLRGVLAQADDGRAWQAPPRTPWTVYGTAAAALAVFALASGMLLSVFAWPAAPLSPCTAAPGDLATLARRDQTEARHGALQAELARLVQAQGLRRLQCPLPAAAAAHPPAPALPPALAPEPALPRDRWDRHDLSLLEGCWHRISNMSTYDPGTNRDSPVSAWRICFGGDGSGSQTITWQDGTRCSGAVTARFAGDRLVTDAARCTGNRSFVRSEEDCVRVSDQEARCIGRNLEGPAASSESRFRR